MPYKISHRQSFVRDLKDFKQNKLQKEAILDAVKRIIENPLLGETLVGAWSETGFRKISFMNRPQLRLFYVLYPCCPLALKEKESCRFDEITDNQVIPNNDCLGFVEFVFIRTRESCNNLYAKDKKYIEGYLLE